MMNRPHELNELVTDLVGSAAQARLSNDRIARNECAD